VSTTSLVQLVSRVALGALVLALGLTGAGTAALLHGQAVRDVDALLLVAAQAGHGREHWVNGHHPGPVAVETWDPRGAPAPSLEGVPAELLEQVVASEEPVLRTVGDTRVLLLAVEPPDVHEQDPAPEHPHALRIATATLPSVLQSTGRFGLFYVLVALATLGLAAAVLPRRLARTLSPLAETTRALAEIQGLAVRSRLPAGGPREVAAVIVAVNSLLERLEAAVSTQTRFTAVAAHELRTPVALLRGELELALRRPRSPDAYREALREALVSVERLAGLVEGLMALARVHAGQVEEGRAPEHLSGLLAAALATERPELERRGGVVTVRVEEDPELKVHGPLLAAAMANLLRNAADHAPGAAVEVGLRAGRGPAGEPGMELVVRDHGPGPAEPPAAGLGLGLRVCREVLARHGGTVSLEPAPGGGCRARLWLPMS
jgi:signal transduction histidine kinase